MTVILGVNVSHDASAAVLVDGEVVAAAEEERFSRAKHAIGLPVEATRWALESAGMTLCDVDHIATSFDPHAHGARRRATGSDARDLAVKLEAIPEELSHHLDQDGSDGCRMHFVEHHPAHIASAFYAAPFADAAVLSADGLGDYVSLAWGSGRDRTFSLDHRTFFPHSLGFFYSAITRYLGFPHYGDEYKVMGLAPYGQPSLVDDMRRIIVATKSDFELDLRYFTHTRSLTWNFVGTGSLFSPLAEDLLGPARAEGEPIEARHRDIAASAQLRLEELLLPILGRLRRRTGLPALAMAGGVALNVTANSRIAAVTGFESVFIQPASSDGGTSLGAALYVAHQVLDAPRRFTMSHAYLGPSFTNEQCAVSADAAGLHFEVVGDEGELCRRAAEAIARGEILGWFQGRMEFGPRALGNRSILCDPRNPSMKATLNTRTKRREAFRPFAPSVLAERAADVYELDGESPYMLFAPRVRAQWRDRLPAVTHVDGTGRVQTVDRATNPRYWALLRAFEVLTDVPVLLNTSFNENEPIVCTPADAIACFLRADIDVLVLEDLLITRDRQAEPIAAISGDSGPAGDP